MVTFSGVVDRVKESRATNKISIPNVYIGLGLFIVAQHGYILWGTSSTTMLGYMLLIAGMGYALYYYRHSLPNPLTFVFYPLLLITLLSGLRMFLGEESLGTSSMYLVLLLFMLGLYYVAFVKGEGVLKLAGPAVLIFSIATIIDGLVNPGERAAGICGNCNTVAALLCVLLFLLRGRWKWCIPIAIIALVLTGSYWALGAVLVAGLYGIITNRVSLKSKVLLVSGVLLVLVALVGFSTGKFQNTWQTSRLSDADFGPREEVFQDALSNASLIGHGFQPRADVAPPGKLVPSEDSRYGQPVHNVPLMVMDDLGILAMLALLVAILYVLFKTDRYKLVILALIIVSFTGQFDYWWFNSLMPLFFVIMGVVSWEIQKEVESSAREGCA